MSNVDQPDFTLEFKAEGLNDVTEADLYDEAYGQLQRLTKGHTDIVGAAVNITKPAQAETSFIFEATVVVYGRPDHTAATEKADNPTAALKGALSAAERQVRSRREKLGRPWEQP